jgi:hypothetical protein
MATGNIDMEMRGIFGQQIQEQIEVSDIAETAGRFGMLQASREITDDAATLVGCNEKAVSIRFDVSTQPLLPEPHPLFKIGKLLPGAGLEEYFFKLTKVSFKIKTIVGASYTNPHCRHSGRAA